ncbi:Gfo/Idh/MocA family oxidoreductase [Fusobacterium varium]|uniref:Gfo/Idh/MocA family oxidoreductase n=1 Tax=Fusobacterium varium TaxID=856 RepID=UPI00356873DF
MKLKVCFYGMGSIGKRHFKNLLKIGKEQNIIFDIDIIKKRNELSEEIKKEIKNLYFNREDLASDYDIVFIVNPTSDHFETINYMKDRAKYMFIEKPIFNKSCLNLKSLKLNEEKCYIAAPLRYSGVFNTLKKVLKERKIYSVRAICSSYLPEWRPQQDYREVYSAKKELGGGVSIDLIHEWDYLVELFGCPERIFNFQGKYSNLEIDSEDISIYIAKYKDKLLEIHLDYFGCESRREIEIFTELGTIKGDFYNKNINFSWNNEVLKMNENEDIYIKEMKNFLNIIKGKKNNNTPSHAMKILKLAEGENVNESID